MIWGAQKAEGRIAAKNATKIRAALGQQIDPNKVWEGYQETQPIKTDNLARDRSRARSWAMLNVNLEMDAVYTALVRLWTEAYVLGQLAAREAIQKAKEMKKAGDTDYIDWDNWQPGDEVTAALVNPPGALERLLNAGGSRIKGLEKETYNEIGSALGESIALGLSGRQAAKLIQNNVQSASRALTIAVTETCRVRSYAAMETYKEFGLEKHEWLPINPCDICALNDGAVVNIGSPFPSGVIQPPQHPNCKCALMPFIPDMSEQPNENGVVDIAPQSTDVTYDDALSFLDERQSFDKILPEGSDQNLYVAREMRGYNGLPRVVSPDEFDAIEGKTVYRGVEKKKFVDEFMTGDNFAGQGVYGNGTYATDAREYALNFAGNNDNLVMELKITPDMKIIDVREMNKWRTTFTADLDAQAKVLELKRKAVFDLQDYKEALAQVEAEIAQLNQIKRYLGHDLGTLATLRGYDAISVPAGEMGLSAFLEETNEYYYVILNRAKVVAKGMP
jgi:SPP1 gp7 family putative phage head morphogenesis protein